MNNEAIINMHLGGSYREDPTRRAKLDQEKKKENCRKKTAHAVKTGKLERKPCQECGDSKVQAHHKDYDKPMEVVWLCLEHHTKLHKSMRNTSAGKVAL